MLLLAPHWNGIVLSCQKNKTKVLQQTGKRKQSNAAGQVISCGSLWEANVKRIGGACKELSEQCKARESGVGNVPKRNDKNSLSKGMSEWVLFLFIFSLMSGF